MQTFQAFKIEFTHHTTTNKRVTTKIETKPLFPNTILKGNYEIQTFLVLIKDHDLETLIPSFILTQHATLIVYASLKKVTTLVCSRFQFEFIF
jgi:xylose isomerase